MKPQNKLFCITITLVLSSLLVCCSPALKASPDISYGGNTAAEMAPMEAAVEDSISANSASYAFTSENEMDADRLVIKNANLTIIVADPEKSMDRITELAEEMGGFVVSANLNQYQLDNGQEVPRGSVTIRIPSESLNQVITQIEAESDQPLESKSIQSQDVTSEYTDLQSKLRNLEDAEEQLRTIMDSAFNTDDVLSVYNRLVEIREQIEVIKGQIQYYDQATALSSVSIELIANAAVQPIQIGGWQPVGVAKEAVQALLDTMRALINIFIWVVIFVLPVLAVIYFVFFLPLNRLWRYLQKHRKQTKTVIETKPE